MAKPALLATTRREALLLSMSAALAAGAPLNGLTEASTTLSPDAIATLRAYADILVPGAAAAGVTDFVSAMLASEDPMLFYKYMDFPMPVHSFYALGLNALNELSLQERKQPYAALDRAGMKTLAAALFDPKLEGWSGPPAILFYFCVKNDGLDVVYGAAAAYERLNIPYMPHIMPPAKW